MAIKPKKVPAVKKPTIDDVYGGAPAAEAPAVEAPAVEAPVDGPPPVEPETLPAPVAEAVPEPEPAPIPEPVSEPVKTEETMSAPTMTPPEPTEPEHGRAEAETPAPAPEPVVEAAAEPEPTPEPEPAKAAEPEAIPEPASVAAPVAEAAHVAATAVVAPVATPSAPAPRRRPVLYAVTAFSLLLSAATTAAVATLPLWQGELDRVWERTDPAAAGTFLIAVQGVSRAAAGSAPFTGAVEVARALAPSGQAPMAAALDRVAAFADKGAPAMPALRAQFETIAAAVRDSAAPRTASAGWAPEWVERTVSELSAALPVGGLMNTGLFGAPPPPTAAPPALRNAEVLLTAGNLREAVASVRSLGTAPAALTSAWLADAQGRIDLDDAARTLERLAVAHHQAARAEPSLEERLNRMVKAAERHLFE